MSKPLKKSLIFFLSLVVVIIIITAVYLLFIDKSGGDGNNTTPSPSASELPSPSTSTLPSVSTPPPSGSVSPSPSPSDAGLVIREDGPDGVTFTVTVPGSFVTYKLAVDEAEFKYDGNIGGEKFTALKDENEFLQIGFYEGISAVKLAPGLLDSYIDYIEFEQSGQNLIDGTEISGQTVAANDGEHQLKAWLVDVNGGVLAVVISYSMSDDAQLPELEKMLGTLTLEP